jgi:hypothetical protein
MISTLTLALSMFSQNNLRVIDVNKSNPSYYQLYYRRSGANRVMLVPKECNDIQQLQREVEILIKRSIEEQGKIGIQDCK